MWVAMKAQRKQTNVHCTIDSIDSEEVYRCVITNANNKKVELFHFVYAMSQPNFQNSYYYILAKVL